MSAQGTSSAALASVKSAAQLVRDSVYDAIKSFGIDGLTTNECAELVEIDKGTVQPRTSELFNEGMIRNSGVRRKNASGRNAIVWVAA